MELAPSSSTDHPALHMWETSMDVGPTVKSEDLADLDEEEEDDEEDYGDFYFSEENYAPDPEGGEPDIIDFQTVASIKELAEIEKHVESLYGDTIWEEVKKFAHILVVLGEGKKEEPKPMKIPVVVWVHLVASRMLADIKVWKAKQKEMQEKCPSPVTPPPTSSISI